MSERGIMFTNLLWHDSRGGEVETRARVIYARHKGYAGSRIDPPEPASVEIIDIRSEPDGVDIPAHFWESEELMQECMEDWEADEIEAQEWRAQARRDELMMRDWQ